MGITGVDVGETENSAVAEGRIVGIFSYPTFNIDGENRQVIGALYCNCDELGIGCAKLIGHCD
ncbi:hypothetical protein SHVI106290_17435 [Shewanella violacea]